MVAQSKKKGGPDVSRREFIKSVGKGALELVLATSCAPYIIGCSKTNDRSYSQTLKEVLKIQKEWGTYPESPVLVSWDSSVNGYPSIKNISGFEREKSDVYSLVEKALMLTNPQNPENPLTNIISPGDTVVIKPNWCTQLIFPIPVTHPSVVYAIAEYAIKAGAKTVRIVEGPMTLKRSQQYYWGYNFINVHNMLDALSKKHPQVKLEFQDGNTDQFFWVDLDKKSEFYGTYDAEDLVPDNKKDFSGNMFFDVADASGFNPKNYKIALYAIARSYLDSDVVINVPKLKTHVYTGITIALKNLMGLNLRTTSSFLSPEAVKFYQHPENFKKHAECKSRDVPHHFSLKALDKYNVTRKSYDNDILWRTLADLNKIILYADRKGHIRDVRQRNYLNVVDGIFGSEKNGPICWLITKPHTIVAGVDPVKVDAACCRIMGWDPNMVPLVKNTGQVTKLPIGSMEDYEHQIIGARLNNLPFGQYFLPPTSFEDKRIAPHSVRYKG